MPRNYKKKKKNSPYSTWSRCLTLILPPPAKICLSSFICSLDDKMWNSLNNLLVSFWHHQVTFKCSNQKYLLFHLRFKPNHVTLPLKTWNVLYNLQNKSQSPDYHKNARDVFSAHLSDSLMPPHAISVLHTNLIFFPLQTFAQAVLLCFQYGKQVLSEGELGIVPLCSRKAFSFHIGHVSYSHAFESFFFFLPPKHVWMDHDLFQNSHCPFKSCSSLLVLFLTE